MVPNFQKMANKIGMVGKKFYKIKELRGHFLALFECLEIDYWPYFEFHDLVSKARQQLTRQMKVTLAGDNIDFRVYNDFIKEWKMQDMKVERSEQQITIAQMENAEDYYEYLQEMSFNV